MLLEKLCLAYVNFVRKRRHSWGLDIRVMKFCDHLKRKISYFYVCRYCGLRIRKTDTPHLGIANMKRHIKTQHLDLV